MRFLIVNTDYPEFLKWLYATNPGLSELSYEVQLRARDESLFGAADFYSSNLKKLGHEAWTIHANNEFLQRAWMHEFGNNRSLESAESRQVALLNMRRFAAATPLKYLKRIFRPMTQRMDNQPPPWFFEILMTQVQYYRPDVLLNQDMNNISAQFLKTIKRYVRLLVGQHASPPLNKDQDFSCYDLIISSFPPTIEYFQQKGIPAEINHLAFEPRVATADKKIAKEYPVSFIGNFFQGFHNSRTELLEYLCKRFEQVSVWAPNMECLAAKSPIRECYKGQAWGQQVYEILRKSQITLNHHADAGPFANNIRMYEATGVGTLLITDWKENLTDFFEPGKEVVAYKGHEECARLVEYYLRNPEEGEAIARAGQKRTLKEHTYFRRMQEFQQIVQKYIGSV